MKATVLLSQEISDNLYENTAQIVDVVKEKFYKTYYESRNCSINTQIGF
jgi:hypothetical protein